MIKHIIAKFINWVCVDEIITVGSIKVMHPRTTYTDTIVEKTTGAGVTVTGLRPAAGTEVPDQFPALPIVGQIFYATDTAKIYVYLGGTAEITGNLSSFTGQANDKIKVIVDSTTYNNINISTCTTIAMVVAAINVAAGGTVALVAAGCLKIVSRLSGVSSNVTIADGTGTGQTVVAELFSIPGNRTATGVAVPAVNSKGWFNLKNAQYAA